MSYNYLSKNKKLLTDLYKRKKFKNYIFHNNNNDGYEWDDYDTTHFYEEEIHPKHTTDNIKEDTKNFFEENHPHHIFMTNYIKNNHQNTYAFEDDKNVYIYSRKKFLIIKTRFL